MLIDTQETLSTEKENQSQQKSNGNILKLFLENLYCVVT